MSLIALGISHQTAPVAVRERLAFTPEIIDQALLGLRAIPGVNGGTILSTCNRTEVYVSGKQPITRAVIDWWHDWHQLRPGQFREHVYILEHNACILHLIKVTAGMDSMVIGEPQVAGQVKQAWQAAHDNGILDSVLDRMFQHAFAAAKRIRHETGIGHNPVTLPFAALRLARQIFGEIKPLKALLVGAGEMIEECAVHFHEASLSGMTIANRSLVRAEALASRFQAGTCGLQALPDQLRNSDLVIACTASRQPLLTREMFSEALRARRRRPIFALDLSVPRNIDPQAHSLEDLYLYTIDDLHAIVESNQRERIRALDKAMQIAESESLTFERWLRLQAASSTLKHLRSRAQSQRDLLLDQARQDLARGMDPEAVIQRLGHRLVNRLLHEPSIRLRQAAENSDEALLEAARYYFLEGWK